MKIITFSTLYPNAARPGYGILRALIVAMVWLAP
jgi:hypothetical protein